jgi:hypothetical protein
MANPEPPEPPTPHPEPEWEWQPGTCLPSRLPELGYWLLTVCRAGLRYSLYVTPAQSLRCWDGSDYPYPSEGVLAVEREGSYSGPLNLLVLRGPDCHDVEATKKQLVRRLQGVLAALAPPVPL